MKLRRSSIVPLGSGAQKKILGYSKVTYKKCKKKKIEIGLLSNLDPIMPPDPRDIKIDLTSFRLVPGPPDLSSERRTYGGYKKTVFFVKKRYFFGPKMAKMTKLGGRISVNIHLSANGKKMAISTPTNF